MIVVLVVFSVTKRVCLLLQEVLHRSNCYVDKGLLTGAHIHDTQ